MRCFALIALLGGAAGAADPSLVARVEPLVKAHEGKVAAVIQRFGDDVAYAVNADEPMPTASLIKFPVMVEAYSQFSEKRCRPGDLCVLHQLDKVPGSGILTDHFTPGMTFTLRDAVRMMIVWSDNTATNIVLDHVGIPATAARMESLGLPNTKIHSKVYRRDTSAWPERSKKFGLGSTTANEMVKLLTLLHEGKLVSPEASKEMIAHMLKCEDPEKFPRFLPAGTKFAFKTGSVSDARTVAGILSVPKAGSDPKKPEHHAVAVCVLTAENKDKRFGAESAGDTLIAKILKEVYDHYHAAR
jgi:beta-lactamase class A